MEKECLISIEMTDEDVIHVFTREEWFGDVWDNSFDPEEPELNPNAMYMIESLQDRYVPTLLSHPERWKYILCIFDLDALIKYPYIKRAVEHDEIKKSWEKPDEEKIENETN
jgi:hypothetical protein